MFRRNGGMRVRPAKSSPTANEIDPGSYALLRIEMMKVVEGIKDKSSLEYRGKLKTLSSKTKKPAKAGFFAD